MSERLHPAPPRAFVLANFVQACCWQVARPPLPGETLAAQDFFSEPGGKGLNVAVGLHRLGARVDALIGCGTDPAGDALLALLAREGLATDHVHRLPGSSGWGAGLIGPDGQNSIVVYPGANLALTAGHVDAARSAIASSRLVYGHFETSLPAVAAAFAIAHQHGMPTVLNPSPWQPVPDAIARTTHTLLVNDLEAAHLLGLSGSLHGPDEAAQAAEARWPDLLTRWPALQRLVITLGEHGALGLQRTSSGGTQCERSPASTIQAVDTVGAGDAFACGYCMAVLADHDLSTALRWGNVCGGHMAARKGVLDALPDAAQLSALLGQTVRTTDTLPIQ